MSKNTRRFALLDDQGRSTGRYYAGNAPSIAAKKATSKVVFADGTPVGIQLRDTETKKVYSYVGQRVPATQTDFTRKHGIETQSRVYAVDSAR